MKNTPVFVFGSNTAGIHGAGAARAAFQKYGAVWGKGYGHHNNSFAIPTKGGTIQSGIGGPLHILDITAMVQGFLAYADHRRDLTFHVTCIGCGLAGFKHEEIAPLFFDAPSNCLFDTLWKDYLPTSAGFWGTF